MVTTEEIEQVALFAALEPAQREQVSRMAADITLAPGDYAVHEGGERALFAVLEGRIEPVKRVDGIERVVGVRRPGDIFGEVPIALGTVFPVGFRAAEPSRVMRIEAHDYHAAARGRGRASLGCGVHGAAALPGAQPGHVQVAYESDGHAAPGIFACGDVRFAPVKRVAAAVGEGQYLKDADASGAASRSHASL